MFSFTKKKIFLFSPEPWSYMRLSKHHYAEALASMGNTVYFLEPANRTATKIVVSEINKNLFVVNYPLKAKGWGKLPGWLYKSWVSAEMKMLKNKLGLPDVVWCFDPIKLVHLSVFSTAYKIYHPVDQFDPIFLNRYTPKFDIAFSTMQKEVDILRAKGYDAHFVQHGLSPVFEPYAKSRLQDLAHNSSKSFQVTPIKVGFAGNLLGDALDGETMKFVIENNKDCHFYFWGKYDFDVNHNSLDDGVIRFVEFLKSASNVTLNGAVPTMELSKQYQAMDMFWVCWKKSDSPLWNAYTNPHKILEYLSTGIPVVTHFMHAYANTGLIYMIGEHEGGKEYANLFQSVKSNLEQIETNELKSKRIQYALSNIYHMHIEEIAVYISGKV